MCYQDSLVVTRVGVEEGILEGDMTLAESRPVSTITMAEDNQPQSGPET